MRKVIVARRAQMDLRRLVDFLAEKSPRAANAAFDALSDALLSLQTLPERGRRRTTPGIANST